MRSTALALLVLALSLVAGLGPAAALAPPAVAPSLALREAPRVVCERPAALRLIRFEDGSARLSCAGRTLVRVGAPG